MKAIYTVLKKELKQLADFEKDCLFRKLTLCHQFETSCHWIPDLLSYNDTLNKSNFLNEFLTHNPRPVISFIKYGARLNKYGTEKFKILLDEFDFDIKEIEFTDGISTKMPDCKKNELVELATSPPILVDYKVHLNN